MSYNKCTNEKLPVVDKPVVEYDSDSTSEPETDEDLDVDVEGFDEIPPEDDPMDLNGSDGSEENETIEIELVMHIAIWRINFWHKSSHDTATTSVSDGSGRISGGMNNFLSNPVHGQRLHHGHLAGSRGISAFTTLCCEIDLELKWKSIKYSI